MILILLVLAGFAGLALGVALTITGKFFANMGAKGRKDLLLARKNLGIAESALRHVSTGSVGNPQLEADIALEEINDNTNNYLEGR